MMNQTYYDYQVKPIIKTMRSDNKMALMAVVTTANDTSSPHASTWLQISADQLEGILKILNTTI
jgi:hypothetical protein